MIFSRKWSILKNYFWLAPCIYWIIRKIQSVFTDKKKNRRTARFLSILKYNHSDFNCKVENWCVNWLDKAIRNYLCFLLPSHSSVYFFLENFEKLMIETTEFPNKTVGDFALSLLKNFSKKWLKQEFEPGQRNLSCYDFQKYNQEPTRKATTSSNRFDHFSAILMLKWKYWEYYLRSLLQTTFRLNTELRLDVLDIFALENFPKALKPWGWVTKKILCLDCKQLQVIFLALKTSLFPLVFNHKQNWNLETQTQFLQGKSEWI